ncbi:MAG: flagellar filament capping protein FliD [Planctomycetota bacterium]|jgi:flagellar hook-associated protein 2
MVSTSGISFSGLGSGLDTNAIVSQLVAVERIPINVLRSRKSTEQQRLDLVGQLGDLVRTLKTKADDLSSPSEFYAYAASITDESVAAVTAGSNAEPGSHSLEVQRLAATDRWAFDAVSARDVNLTDTAGQQISFSVGTTNYSLTVDPAESSLDQIASQINQMAADDVDASVVNTGTESNPTYQLVLTSKNSGEEGRITDLFSDVAGATESLSVNWSAPDLNGEAQSTNNVTVGNDALAKINGLEVRRADNTFTGVIEGVTLDLRSTTPSGPVSISIDPDRAAVRGKIDDFVTAYNAVMEFMNTQNQFTPAEGDDGGGTTGGLLFGDSLLSSVRRNLQRALFDVDVNTVSGDTEGYSTLSLVGIDQAQDGTLSVNSTVFDEKFTDNLEALMDLFADTDGFDNGGAAPNTPEYYVDTTADTGLMNKLVREVDQMFGALAAPDGVEVQGIFDLREDAIREAIDRYDDRIERREDRLTKYEETLILRFARLEELLGGLNAQGTALNNILG